METKVTIAFLLTISFLIISRKEVQKEQRCKDLSLRLCSFAALREIVPHTNRLVRQSKCRVINAETGEVVPYATIKILHTGKGAYSNERGEFELAFAVSDSILITSIGFKPKVFVIRDEKLSAFKLSPAAQELQKITVKNRKLSGKQILGNLNSKSDGYWFFFHGGEEVAQLVRFPLKDDNIFKIKKVTIPIQLARISIPVVLHLYSVSDSGRPGKQLLSRTYVIGKSNVRRNKAVINLENEDLWINDESIFVVVHAQMPADYNPRNHGNIMLPLSYQIKDTLTLIRGFFGYTSVWTPILAIPYVQGAPDRANKKLINSLFTLEVEEYR